MLSSPFSCRLDLRNFALSGPHPCSFPYGPVTRCHPEDGLSMGFRDSVSLFPAIQATRLWLLPWWDCLPPNVSAFSGHTTVRASLPVYGSKKSVTDWLPQMACPLMAGVLALFAALLAASNIHQDKSSSLRPVAGSPVVHQRPFRLGRCPIQQLIVSLCLSAAGLRFLQHPTPAEGLTLPRGRVTGL